MTPGDPNDPLLRQVLPSVEELVPRPGYSIDPVGDSEAIQAPGLLKKYRGRALLLVTGACAVHCRYCFRRHFPYADSALIHDHSRAAIRSLQSDSSISEVILSGGDPLMYDDHGLDSLFAELERLQHVRRLRLHTRIPIVLPSRITPKLCEVLSGRRLKTLVVVHVNHARELSDEAHGSLAALRKAGIDLLNQSVLLRGVNDSAQTLAGLSEALFDCGVLPYYLHMMDPVAGGAHFDVPATEARQLLDRLRPMLPGYLVPRLVREIPGAEFKQPV
jgi:EF-P beta-lysylation protein EpmB